MKRLLIILLGALLFIPFLGFVHLFDWDEANFAEAAREMLTTHDYFTVNINYLPFWEKPPLFFWLQAASMNIFGVNEFAARLPNALCGIITLLVLFNIGKKLYNEKFGLIWVMAYAGSILPFFYFKTAIIDPWFNLFIFSGVYFLFLFSEKENSSGKTSCIILSAIFIGLAILTKGPVALLLFILTVFIYLVLKRQIKLLSLKQLLLFILIVIVIGGFWFIVQIFNGKFSLISDFVNYQIRLLKTKAAGHGGFLFYHFVVLFFGVFPSSIYALEGMFSKCNEDNIKVDFRKLMIILLAVVLVVFTIVKTKIVHYSSLSYFPLSYLAAYTVYKIINNEVTWNKWFNSILIALGILIGIAAASLQFIDKYKQQIIDSGIIKDRFSIECLKANVHWSGYEFLVGTIFITGIIIAGFMFKKYKLQSIIFTYISTLIFTNLMMIVIAPKIEGYSQNAAIEFYKSKQHENCYIETTDFKSYAYLFYSQKVKPLNNNSSNFDWLLSGNIDKPVYFVCKINDADDFQKAHPDIQRVYTKNGFVFFLRTPVKTYNVFTQPQPTL